MRSRPKLSPEVNQSSRLEDPSSLARRGFLKGSLSCLLLPALSAPFLASCGGNSVVAPTPRLTSVNNFRDVAGANDMGVYRTSAGGKLRRGVIYRSNALAPVPADLAILNTLNIRADCDLRTPGEIKQQPDIPPTAVTPLNINLVGTADVVTPTLTSAADGIAYMENSYTVFVTDSGVRDRLAQVFQHIASSSDSQVYHCSGGKDRTGWVTMILLTVVGVPQNVIFQDYLLTNVYSQASIQASYQQMVTAYGEAYADAYYPSFIADQRYLDAGLNEVVTSYGTLTDYISSGLGLSSTLQAQLQDKLLA